MNVFCCSTRLVLEIYLIAVLPLILTLKLLLSIKYIIGVVNALLISILCAKINGSKHSVMLCKAVICDQNNVHFPP